MLIPLHGGAGLPEGIHADRGEFLGRYALTAVSDLYLIQVYPVRTVLRILLEVVELLSGVEGVGMVRILEDPVLLDEPRLRLVDAGHQVHLLQVGSGRLLGGDQVVLIIVALQHLLGGGLLDGAVLADGDGALLSHEPQLGLGVLLVLFPLCPGCAFLFVRAEEPCEPHPEGGTAGGSLGQVLFGYGLAVVDGELLRIDLHLDGITGSHRIGEDIAHLHLTPEFGGSGLDAGGFKAGHLVLAPLVGLHYKYLRDPGSGGDGVRPFDTHFHAQVLEHIPLEVVELFYLTIGQMLCSDLCPAPRPGHYILTELACHRFSLTF